MLNGASDVRLVFAFRASRPASVAQPDESALSPACQSLTRAGSKVPAHERRRGGLAAVGRMIAACRHGDRAATDYEIAW
jgi:hypothetical protein